LIFQVGDNLVFCIADAAATDTGVTEAPALSLALNRLRRAAERLRNFLFGR
jgi:hypothetical protein